MKLIVGLGNPGPRYARTFHNVGFAVVDRLAAKHGAAFGAGPAEAVTARVRGTGHDLLLAKPLTFMNLSGRAVHDLVHYYRIVLDDLLVVVDDVNLPLGKLRARAHGSPGGHNGLKSIVEAFGTNAFPRLRVGVGRGDPRRDLADHVLARIGPGDAAALDEAETLAVEACEHFVECGIAAVMNRYNASA